MSILIFKNEYHPKAKRGSTYSEEISFPYETVIAYEKDGMYYALGPGTPILFSENNPTISIEEWLKGTFGASEFNKKDIMPGTYFKRIWKPGLANFNALLDAMSSKEVFHQSSVSLLILLRKLSDLFEVVEPNPKNLPSYGHKIRELLLLACMEVESSWSAVLREHNYSVKPENKWNTSDYVKLLDPMLLKYYTASLRAYPQCPVFKPFKNWDNGNPTPSLVWYDAYNKTKHNREKYLDMATLHNAIEAVVAAVIMHRAQFGARFKRHWMLEDGVDDDIREIFDVDIRDVHQQIAEFYVPDVTWTDGQRGEKIASPSQTWNAIQCNFS
jgi:hypothetical protein